MQVFISYSHDSEEHRKWVLNLALKLKLNGIRVILDQTHLNAGDYLTTFMEDYIETVDYVLMICTDNYNERAKERKGGVGYEINLISAEIFENPRTSKFIPIVRNVTVDRKTPACVNGRLYCDFSNDNSFDEQLNELVQTIKGDKVSDRENKREEKKDEGWSAVVDGEEILFKQGEPFTISFEDGKIEKYLVINDDIMCLEQTFPNGAIAYIEVNKDGDIVTHKFPYPISEYQLIIDKNLVVDSKTFQDENGFTHFEAFLKWGRHCSWILDPNKKLHSYRIEKGCELNHIAKQVIIK
ncbi:toll/interleukin-1 receptor domain-containing protein [Marinifilum flexuosum]|uniref:toll/interleukin-1 receptor domain-containing protein n=1 Tax=Marinifilum flexuosum TaxID=1117708 RepID=UPI00249030C3|nr:toll/interleukin-1 receptor domain-containing protein [Marinifilum flexuosum]